jgi:hypothetical protein
MSRRTTKRLIVLLLGATLLVLTGCGASGSPETVAAATDATERERSWRVVETTIIREPVLERTVARGVVDVAAGRSHFIVDLGPASKDDPSKHIVDGRLLGEEIRIGDVVYHGRVLANTTSRKPWVKLDYTRAFGTDEARDSETDATNPAAELRMLRVVSADFRDVGEEDIRGLAATHYRGSMNVGAVEGTWDVWVAEGLIRRTRFTDPDGSFVSTTEYYDFGVQARIEAPPAHLVDDETETLLPSPEKCRGPGEPISIDLAVKTLRKHGFTVFRDSNSASCGGRSRDEHILTDLTNVLFSGPHENIESHDEITKREGHLICTVRRRPIYGGGGRVQDRTEPGEEASLILANLECGLYPEDAGDRATYEKRLREALRKLQAALAKK